MPSTRRDALGAAAVALSACLAGCNAFSATDSSRTPHPGTGDRVTDYETARQVATGDRRLFRWTGDDHRSSEHLLVTTRDERAAVAFDLPADDPVPRFVAETDFDRAALALFQRRHGACVRLDTFGLERRPDELRVHLCTKPRPADERCRTDRQRSTLLAVRIPVEGEAPPELSVVRSSRCEDRYGPSRDGGKGR